MKKIIFSISLAPIFWSCHREINSNSATDGINSPCNIYGAQRLSLQEALALKAKGRLAFHVTRSANLPNIVKTGLLRWSRFRCRP